MAINILNKLTEDKLKEEKVMSTEINESSTNVSIKSSSESDQIVQVRTNCSTCLNEPICKFVAPYVHCKEELESIEIPEIVKLEMSCKYYKSVHQATVKSKVPIYAKYSDEYESPKSVSSGIQIKHTKLSEEHSAGDKI